MNIQVYFSRIEGILQNAPHLISLDFNAQLIDANWGYFKAKLVFSDNSKLFLFELAETINTSGKNLNEVHIIKYRYHYQNKNNLLIKRWDNAPHFPNLKTFPHHLHKPNNVVECLMPSIENVLLEILKNISS